MLTPLPPVKVNKPKPLPIHFSIDYYFLVNYTMKSICHDSMFLIIIKKKIVCVHILNQFSSGVTERNFLSIFGCKPHIMLSLYYYGMTIRGNFRSNIRKTVY